LRGKEKTMAMFANFRRTVRLVATLILLSVFAVSCTGVDDSEITLEDIARYATGTAQALSVSESISPTQTPLPTATPIPPTPIPPTKTPLPTLPPILPDATRISFAPGATYGYDTGTIEGGETKDFVLKALVGQPMLVSVNSHNNDVILSIITEDGVELQSTEQNWPTWQGTLPATQDYYIQISGAQSSEIYSLWVTIPSRIKFDPGATSATVEGIAVDGYIASYVIAAQGGQTMDILLTPTPDAAALTVWGFSDGQPYMRSVTGSTVFHMQLPSTQDYIINVVPFAGREVTFTLQVEIQ